MKKTDTNTPIDTIPDGVWESSRPVPDKNKKSTASESTDLQKNGYPDGQDR